MATYKGNPNNYPTTLTIVDDASPPNATNFNTPIEGLADEVAWMQERGSLSPLLALQPAFTVQTLSSFSSAKGPHAAAWNDTALAVDPVAGQKWNLAVWDTSTTHVQVFAGYADGTDAWAQVGGNIAYTQSATSLAVDPASGAIFVAGVGGISSTNADIFRCPAGGSFASWAVVGTATPTDAQVAVLAGVMFYAVGSSTASNAKISGDFGGGFVSLSVSKWIVRSGGGMVLFVPAQAMASPIVYKATGTVTYSSAAIGLATTDIPLDLTWSAAWGLWFLVAKTVGGASTIWTSPDGVTWTLAKTFTHLPKPLVAIASIGIHILGALDAPTFGNLGRVVSSSDAGLTWYAAPTGVLTNSASSPVTRVFAGPAQMFYGQLVAPGSSGASSMRFSYPMGRGDVALT